MKKFLRQMTNYAASSLLLASLAGTAAADLAILVDTAVLVETNPVLDVLIENNDLTGAQPSIAPPRDASYVSSGGWAVTGAEFIDASTMVFDFGETGSVTAATLRLNIRTVYAQNNSAPIRLEFYSDDNGVVEYTDYTIGFPEQIGQLDAFGQTQVQFDVTGPVNAALRTGRFVGFRVLSTIEPAAVDPDLFPAFTGVRFFEDQSRLEFVPGAPPATSADTGSFNGYVLEVPNIDIPTIGQVYAQFQLVDPNNLIFQLNQAIVTGAAPTSPPVSGLDLFNCSAFEPPVGAEANSGASTYSVNSGVLDIPDTAFNGQQFGVRMEYIEGTADPILFELLDFGEIDSGPSESILTDVAGGLSVEPTQDFIPACHGWILIGDFIRNRFVERNVISGETGRVYQLNTSPSQLKFDEPNGLVYFTVHPNSERLYKLDLATREIEHYRLSQELFGLTTSFTYGFALNDIAIGEDGNLFALLVDNVLFNPEDDIPFSDTGKWMSVIDPNGNFLIDSIPLEEPVRIEYDPVQKHVFLATTSNLATLRFDPGTNGLTLIQGTDTQVGSNCTDLSISPDGTRLAYSCPNGNGANEENQTEFSIWDMAPDSYFDIDGEWFLEAAPVSAVFNQEGTILIASDNKKLYFFDVATHLLLEDFNLGLTDEESVKRIRFSKDGDLILIFLNNDFHNGKSRFLYMPTPSITGTPL